ncbi:hypothetical protein N0B31_19785 [Salinirubellus salinus]|uniref:CHAT domain-containing protein n=1 Tax=Salinirubellus salinus TaxID=1364945 RepID=A0A9E7U4I2_9EURY|nr:hypothetical protein [Salinirubellus salinus]UWM54345.1 hypothetical protein N0B31_19785 [Salinirubellus salinus]
MGGSDEPFVFDPETLAADAATPTVTALPGGRGVRVHDPIEGGAAVFRAPVALDPTALDEAARDARFTFPVTTAVTVRTPSLTVPRRVNVRVRDPEATLVAESSNRDGATVPAGRWNLELDVTGLKLYLAVDAPVTVTPATHETTITFGTTGTDGAAETADDDPVDVAVGVRSHHSRPAGIVTVPRTPTGVMDGLSVFGSALKTRSPERSFPTLRGHPPLLAFGDAFDVPADLEPVGDAPTLTCPPAYEYVYPLASLASYLGARVEPGDPALHAAGRTYPLDAVDESPRVTAHRPESTPADPLGRYETAVRDVFRHLFLLDTVVRTVGYYDVALAEREAIERHLPLSLRAAYDAPLAERTAAYLAVPLSVTAPAWPRWRLTATAPAVPETARHLPFLAADLALVRTSPTPAVTGGPEPALVQAEGGGESSATARSGTRSGVDGWADADVVDVPPAPESLSQAWLGEGIPRGASKATLRSYARHLERATRVGGERDSRISMAVVCNDAEMREELVVGDIYGARDLVTFDVERYELTDRETLASVFESDLDFVHYIGHVEERGLQCADGFLAADSIGRVGVESFFLNACRSYRPGQTLVDKGALAGVVTLSDVVSRSATVVGRTLARILNAGYPLQLAVDVLGEDLFSASNYVVLGDGNAELVTAASGTPVLLEVESSPNESFDATMSAYPTHRLGMGSFYVPYVGSNRRAYLNTGRLDTFRVTAAELDEVLALEDIPVRVPGRTGLAWSDELTAADLSDLLAAEE